MKIIIVDIDGTISKVGDRLKYLLQDPKDWDSFYNDCFDDEPILEICTMVEELSFGYPIVFCTGRRESCRDKTIQWINKYMNNIEPYQLLMRHNKDYRHDTEVKPELINNAGILLKDIRFVLEDRNSMVKKWRELGLICLQVAEGDF
jgi:hypothetical protein